MIYKNKIEKQMEIKESNSHNKKSSIHHSKSKDEPKRSEREHYHNSKNKRRESRNSHQKLDKKRKSYSNSSKHNSYHSNNRSNHHRNYSRSSRDSGYHHRYNDYHYKDRTRDKRNEREHSFRKDSLSPRAKYHRKTSRDNSAENKGNVLYIKNIHPKVSEDKIKNIFSSCGKIEEISLVKEPNSDDNRGFGFITFVNPNDAEKACRELDKTKIEGYEIIVEKSKRSRGYNPTPGVYLGPQTHKKRFDRYYHRDDRNYHKEYRRDDRDYQREYRNNYHSRGEREAPREYYPRRKYYHNYYESRSKSKESRNSRSRSNDRRNDRSRNMKEHGDRK
ncbi:MAG: hypothetical protein MJ252_13020 [archaeon]|nr:hypothetical protein [archaeon]